MEPSLNMDLTTGNHGKSGRSALGPGEPCLAFVASVVKSRVNVKGTQLVEVTHPLEERELRCSVDFHGGKKYMHLFFCFVFGWLTFKESEPFQEKLKNGYHWASGLRGPS